MAALSEAPASAPAKDPRPWNLAALFRRSLAEPADRPIWWAAAACLSLFLLLFRDVLWLFYHSWTTDENYSHGFLVPLIALYFADQATRRGPVVIAGGGRLGLSMLLASVLIRLMTIPLPIPFVVQLAFITVEATWLARS